jgi:hypothetical protein
MFFHVRVEAPGISSWFSDMNLLKEQALEHWVCPFITREPLISEGRLFNVGAFGGLTVWATDRPIDSDLAIAKGGSREGWRRVSRSFRV